MCGKLEMEDVIRLLPVLHDQQSTRALGENTCITFCNYTPDYGMDTKSSRGLRVRLRTVSSRPKGYSMRDEGKLSLLCHLFFFFNDGTLWKIPTSVTVRSRL